MIENFNLGNLADPTSNQLPLKILESDLPFCIDYLRGMIQIRTVERQLAAARKAGLIGGPVHLGVGQEAVAVGVSASLLSSDKVFGAHRSHSHLLALGGDVRKLFAEVLGRNTGHSKGMGGSMHLWDQSVGFYGSVPIVAGTVALAVGAGMAAKMKKTADIAISYLGDGAVEEGVVHESLNLARIFKVPVIFVVENNLFASHMHISKRQPADSTARFAAANDIPYSIVDGNNVLSVKQAASQFIKLARAGNGPAFIEAVTYRWYGHVDWREDIDVGVNRSKVDVENWRRKDPIRRLSEGMIEAKIWTLEEQKALETKIQVSIEKSWLKAMEDPYPSNESLLERVYARV